MRFWLLTCVALATAAVAAPKKPVVVVDSTPAVVKLLSKSLGSRYTVIPAGKRSTGEIAFINVAAVGKQLHLSVLNAADGNVLGVVSLSGTTRKPPRTLPKARLSALLAALALARATPGAAAPTTAAPTQPTPATTEPVAPESAAAEPATTEPATTEPEEAPEPEPANSAASTAAEAAETEPPAPLQRSAHYAFRVSLQGGVFNRNLYALGSIDAVPRPLNAQHAATGNFSAELSVFPGAAFTSNFLAHLGAFFSLDVGLNPRLNYTKEGLVPGSASRLRFGAQGRVPLGDHVSLVAHAGYSRHTLFTYLAERQPGDTPDMLLNGFRGGLQLRWHIAGPVEVELGGAAQYVASLGTLREEFPRARAFAIDAGLAVSVELVAHVRLRLSGEWQRYFISLNPDPDSRYQTRAAGDQYVWVTGGLQWSM